MAPVDVPTLAYPVAVQDGQFKVVDVESPAAVLQSVQRICAVEQGSLAGQPNVGLPSLEFQRLALSPEDLAQLIEVQEPRAAVEIVQMPEPGEGWEQLDIRVSMAGES